jgi:von Willebrand factor type A domain
MLCILLQYLLYSFCLLLVVESLRVKSNKMPIKKIIQILTFLFVANSGFLLFSFFSQSSQKNIVNPSIILVDNSGSMGICSKIENKKCIPNAELPYRLDIVKATMRNHISQANIHSAKIGLVEFGNYRGYGLPKEKACSAARTIVSSSVASQMQVINRLDEMKVNDDGKTPIGYAINFTINSILRKQNLLPANILLITDGEPNCDEEYQQDLCDIVSGLSNRQVQLKIKIIGYKAKGKDNQFIECAKKFPDMVSYLPANNPDELDKQFSKALSPVNINWSITIGSTSLIVLVFPLIYLIKKTKEKHVNIYTLEKSNIENYTFNISGQNISAVGKTNEYTNTNILIQKQIISEAAIEIQNLLKHFEEENPDAKDNEKIDYVNNSTTPKFKRSLLGAIKAGSEAAIEEFMDTPYISIGKAIIRGWREGWIKSK